MPITVKDLVVDAGDVHDTLREGWTLQNNGAFPRSRIFYLRTDGNDESDGTQDSPYGAFKTIRVALKKIASLSGPKDARNGNYLRNIILYIGDGEYDHVDDESILPSTYCRTFHMIGNVPQPHLVVIKTGGNPVRLSLQVQSMNFEGIAFQCEKASTHGPTTWASGGNLTATNCHFYNYGSILDYSSTGVFRGYDGPVRQALIRGQTKFKFAPKGSGIAPDCVAHIDEHFVRFEGIIDLMEKPPARLRAFFETRSEDLGRGVIDVSKAQFTDRATSDGAKYAFSDAKGWLNTGGRMERMLYGDNVPSDYPKGVT